MRENKKEDDSERTRTSKANKRPPDFQSGFLPVRKRCHKQKRRREDSNLQTGKPDQQISNLPLSPIQPRLQIYQMNLQMQFQMNLHNGSAGIRTQAPVTRPSGFQDRSLQPLEYASI